MYNIRDRLLTGDFSDLGTASPQGDLSKWEAQLNQLLQSGREDDPEYAQGMRDAWEKGLGDYGQIEKEWATPEVLKFDDEGIPLLDEYVFGSCIYTSSCT